MVYIHTYIHAKRTSQKKLSVKCLLKRLPSEKNTILRSFSFQRNYAVSTLTSSLSDSRNGRSPVLRLNLIRICTKSSRAFSSITSTHTVSPRTNNIMHSFLNQTTVVPSYQSRRQTNRAWARFCPVGRPRTDSYDRWIPVMTIELGDKTRTTWSEIRPENARDQPVQTDQTNVALEFIVVIVPPD